MNSATLPSFWENYRKLDKSTRNQAKKAFRIWLENPFHPSLRFKCINREENI
jgi:mRNA-degrading endonuclease RelE of RelBE toxin-antitoxin system